MRVLKGKGFSFAFKMITETFEPLRGILAKVLFNALPRAFTFNSTYALFPFFTNKSIKKILKDLHKIKDYDVERKPSLPTIQGVNSYEAVKAIFSDPATYTNGETIFSSAFLMK
jgi:hypothetical protein